MKATQDRTFAKFLLSETVMLKVSEYQRIGDKFKENYQCALVQLISMPSQYKLVHNRVTKRDPRWISNGTFCAIANIWKALWQHKKVNDVTSWTLCCFICLKKNPNRTLNGVKNILREHCSFHNNVFLQGIFCSLLKFMFSKKATQIENIFTINLTLCSK